ncbi:hypothetical protein [Ancylomarina longa]|uniref:Uncharacterized protein n=1 Tax=Ancylomarina longa TaxID=2487017 RepID=A0A434AEN7_9BACT|nr:hypothetical protein [Ancylomarina longa]RUT72853.1 hypothetical protein DLK05_16340 [Ancylomarina longa]
MSEEEILNCKAKVEAMLADLAVESNQPISIFTEEAETLESWAMDDKEKLAIGGISEDRIKQIGIRAEVLRFYQASWIKIRRTGKESEIAWKEMAEKAADLCQEMKHAFRYAFRNDAALLGRVSEIAQGYGDADMIQDLKTYSELGLDHQELLAAIGFDVAKLAEAGRLSTEGANLLAEANGSKLKGNESKVIRDKAYTYLKEVVDEVRACGKYLFWKDPIRIKGYQSDYWKSKNGGKKKSITPEVEA